MWMPQSLGRHRVRAMGSGDASAGPSFLAAVRDPSSSAYAGRSLAWMDDQFEPVQLTRAVRRQGGAETTFTPRWAVLTVPLAHLRRKEAWRLPAFVALWRTTFRLCRN